MISFITYPEGLNWELVEEKSQGRVLKLSCLNWSQTSLKWGEILISLMLFFIFTWICNSWNSKVLEQDDWKMVLWRHIWILFKVGGTRNVERDFKMEKSEMWELVFDSERPIKDLTPSFNPLKVAYFAFLSVDLISFIIFLSPAINVGKFFGIYDWSTWWAQFFIPSWS